MGMMSCTILAHDRDDFDAIREEAERRRQASAKVSQIRDNLTETQFRRIWMYYVGGMTVDEVGEKEGVSLQKCRRLSHFYFPSFAATNQRPFSNHR